MINIMLVDDEKNIRELIKRIIDWEKYGFTIACEAEDGLEAMENMKNGNIDIVIADINMPNLDGLKFAEYVKENHPQTKVVILTAYDEFEYAKKAVNAGVFSYLLKPIDDVELLDVMNRAKNTLIKEMNKDELLKNTAAQRKQIIRKEFLLKLLQSSSSLSEEYVKKRLNETEIIFKGEYFRAIIVELELSNTNSADSNKTAVDGSISIIKDILENDEESTIICSVDNTIYVILNSLALMSTKKYNIYILALNEIKWLIDSKYKIKSTIGCGLQYNGIKNLSTSYIEALYALRWKFILGSDRVIEYESSNIKVKRDNYPYIDKHEILANMRTGEVAKFKENLKSIYNIASSGEVPIDYVQLLYYELLTTCMTYIRENNLDIDRIFDGNINLIDKLNSCETLYETHKFIEYVCEKIVNEVNNDESKANKIVSEALKYVEENISNEELNVSTIAQKFFISSDYLTQLFKMHIGVSVIKYLNNYRMTLAKKLMDDGYTNIEYISERIGFSDSNYFGKCFKKYFGISPSRYLSNKE